VKSQFVQETLLPEQNSCLPHSGRSNHTSHKNAQRQTESSYFGKSIIKYNLEIDEMEINLMEEANNTVIF